MIELGSKVRDVVSGFEGTVTGRAEYAYETTKALVCAKTDQGSADDRWIAVARLESIDGGRRTGFSG